MLGLEVSISLFVLLEEEIRALMTTKDARSGGRKWNPSLMKNRIGTVEGELNTEFFEWLNRSLVCSTDDLRDLVSLSSAILCNFGPCSKITALINFQYVITLPSEQAVEETLQNPQELTQWFSETKKWSQYDTCETGNVWLEVFGVLPHGWSWEKFQKITDIYGILISLGKPIIRTVCFESMKLLMVTDMLRTIKGELFLNIEGSAYRIFIKEVGAPFQTIQQECHHSSESRKGKEHNKDNDVPGFEDLLSDTNRASNNSN